MAPCDDLVRVRRARPDDARGIAEVNVATWREAYRDLLPQAYLGALSVDARAESWAKNLTLHAVERRTWVAEASAAASAEIIGFVSGGAARDEEVSPDTGEVYAIYVMPDCWDRGLGKMLLQHIERDLLSHGFTAAVLWCLAENQRARRFYELYGWHADGQSKTADFGGHESLEVRYRIALERSRVAST